MRKILITIVLLLTVTLSYSQLFYKEGQAIGNITGFPTSVTPKFIGEVIYSTDRDVYYEAYGVAAGEWNLWNPLTGSFSGDGTARSILDMPLEVQLRSSNSNYYTSISTAGYFQIKNPTDNGVRIGNLGTTSQLNTAPNSVIIGDRNVNSTSGTLERSLVAGLHGCRNCDGNENIVLSVSSNSTEGAGSELTGSNNIVAQKNAGRNFTGSNGIALGVSAGQDYTGNFALLFGSGAGAGGHTPLSSIFIALGTDAARRYGSYTGQLGNIIAIGPGTLRPSYSSENIENSVAVGPFAAFQVGYSDNTNYFGYQAGYQFSGVSSDIMGYRGGYLGSAYSSQIIGNQGGYQGMHYQSFLGGISVLIRANSRNSIVFGPSTGGFDTFGDSSNGPGALTVTVSTGNITVVNSAYSTISSATLTPIWNALGARAGMKVTMSLTNSTGTLPGTVSNGNSMQFEFENSTTVKIFRDLTVGNGAGTGDFDLTTGAIYTDVIVLDGRGGAINGDNQSIIGQIQIDSTILARKIGIEHNTEDEFRFYRYGDGRTAFTYDHTNERLRVNGNIQYLDGGVWTDVGSGGGGGSNYTYTQTSHGFSIGDAVIFTVTGFTAPAADQVPTAVVIDVPDANTLTVSNNAIFEEATYAGWAGEADGQSYHTNAGTSGTPDAVVRKIWNKQNGLVIVSISLEEEAGISNFIISDAQGGETVNTSGQTYVLNSNKVNYSNTVLGVAVTNLKDAVDNLAANAGTNTRTVVTSTVTVELNAVNKVDVSGGTQTIVVPAGVAPGDWFLVVDHTRNANTNNITIDITTTNGYNVEGVATDKTINTQGGAYKVTYIDATYGFLVELDK